jgi:formylglycine-generating enzyme required for sulfatase activity
MGNNPSNFKSADLPVENVSFIDAIMFCNKLSKQFGYQEVYTITNDEIFCNQDIKGYRLPTETEWEYVLGYNSADIQENLNTIAWYSDNSEHKTHEVGKKKENSFGIYDLLGNVWEWCFDSKDNSKLRVLRGGSFADYKAQFITQGFRKEKNENSKSKDVGFRIILQNHINN